MCARAYRYSLVMALAVVCGVAEVHADDIDLPPSGRFGLKIGGRQGVGRADHGLGFSTAVVAGYHPIRPENRISFGAEWAVSWSFFEFADATSINGSVRLLEFDVGGRIRLQPSRDRFRFLVLGAGILLMRSSVPIAPDSKRSYVGPYVSVGLEPKVGKYSLSFDARYGMIATGPSTITLSVTISVGK